MRWLALFAVTGQLGVMPYDTDTTNEPDCRKEAARIVRGIKRGHELTGQPYRQITFNCVAVGGKG